MESTAIILRKKIFWSKLEYICSGSVLYIS
ncbi:MAG: hypothetical protein RMZ43_023315 [Nostoc sp. CmiVER01]